MPVARYQRIASWYDAFITGPAAEYTATVTRLLCRLLGAGPGRCVDIGCGTGVHAPALSRLGWSVAGIDLAPAQLQIARRRGRLSSPVCGDALRLPLSAASADAVVAALIHTDVTDWGAVVREAARVLRPGGRFAYVGTHPCFVGPFVQRREDGSVLLRPGYDDRRIAFEGPGLGCVICGRVGVQHKTIEDVLGGVLGAGLRLREVAEHGEPSPPALLGIQAGKPG